MSGVTFRAQTLRELPGKLRLARCVTAGDVVLSVSNDGAAGLAQVIESADDFGQRMASALALIDKVERDLAAAQLHLRVYAFLVWANVIIACANVIAAYFKGLPG